MEGTLYMNMKEPGFLQTTSYRRNPGSFKQPPIVKEFSIFFLSNFKKNIKNCFL